MHFRAIVLLILSLNSSFAFGSENVPWQTLLSDSEDASLRFCGAASLDNLWAVGDRGLAMRSTDGGRSWKQATVGSNVDFRQVSFADSKVGYIVGGFIWPVTGRSDGCVLRTNDGGETWAYSPIMSVGRLSGIHLFSKDHFYAWGDWSAEERGALLESQDGGKSFGRKEVPCAHVTAAAWLNPNYGVVVDRLSRVFVTRNGSEYQQVELPASPLSPIRAASSDGKTVWLSGDNAQLYKSTDLQTWEKVSLNALGSSAFNISLTSVRISTKGQVWLTTNLPGVMLSSLDGKTFQVHQTACQTQLNNVCCISSEQVIAVGAMNNIIETRNAGEGWWVKNKAGSKLGMLVIAPRLQDIALDALVQSSLGEKQHAGALIIHSQDALSKADAWPDAEQRFHQMCGVSVGSWSNILPQFPVGSLIGNANRKSDLFGYDTNGTDPSAIEKELIFAIRTLRPDIVVVATSEQNSPLATRATSAVYHAIQLAGDPRFKLINSEAFADIPSWRVQRALNRIPKSTTNALADWTIEPTGVLGSTGQTVADRVRIASGLLLSPQDATCLFSQESTNSKSAPHESIYWNRMSLYGNYLNRSTNNRSKGQFASCYAGLLQNEDAKRSVSEAKVKNFQQLLATTSLNKALNTLSGMDLETESQRNKWLQYLQGYIETLSVDDKARFLLELGLIYQNHGNASQWALCEEFVIAEPKSTVWKEVAISLATQYSASSEYRRVFGTLERTVGGARLAQSHSSSTIQPAAFVSPFEADVSGQKMAKPVSSTLVTSTIGGPQGANDVFSATYTQQKFDLQIPVTSEAQNPTQNQNTPSIQAPIDSSDNTIPLMDIATRVSSPNQYDPRTLFSRISKERHEGKVDEKQSALLRTLSSSNSVLLWSALASKEIAILNKRERADVSSDVIKVPPVLDGNLNDQLWQSGTVLRLTSPWPEEIQGESQVIINNDDRFLYLAIRCSLPGGAEAKQQSVAKKSAADPKVRDASMNESDHVSIRIDFDRDYQTYYQFSVSADRNRRDSLNHFVSWNPKWFVDQAQSSDAWTAELAIPLEELADPASIPDTIAVNVRREIPGVGIQNLGGIPADGWFAQSYQLVPLTATKEPQ